MIVLFKKHSTAETMPSNDASPPSLLWSDSTCIFELPNCFRDAQQSGDGWGADGS